MKQLLLAATLSLTLLGARSQAQPAPTPLPPGVHLAATKTVRLVTFRLGAHGSPVLVHVWTATRRPHGSANDTHDTDFDRVRPFCADLYVPSGKPNEWRWVNQVLWNGASDLLSIEARWLQPRHKRGPVLLMEIGVEGWPSRRFIVAAFPNGVQESSHWQEYGSSWSSPSGGTFYRFDRTDKQGLMVIHQINEGWTGNSVDHYWDGSRGQFVPGKPY